MRILTVAAFAAAAAVVGASLAPAKASIRPMPAPVFQRGIVPRGPMWHPSVLPLAFQLRAFEYAAEHAHQLLPRKSKAAVKEWLMDDAGFIWGLSGKKIVTYLSDCSGAEGGIVDRARRLIVACTNTASVNIYNAGNTTGPANVVLSDVVSSTSFFPSAAFEDTKGNIYATNLFADSSSTIVWWTKKNQKTGATPSGNYISPNINYAYFGDIDVSGNVYLDGFNYSGTTEVDEITNFLKKPKATNLNISLSFPGGVYVVSPRGATPLLSVLDQGTFGVGNDVLYQYTLPVAPSPTPITTSHPPQNFRTNCDPVSGGYNKKENLIIIGDASCRAADIGNPPTNTWRQVLNANFQIPIDGAFIPSDK